MLFRKKQVQHKAKHETGEDHSFLYIKSDVLNGSKAKRNRYLHKFASEETEEQRGVVSERENERKYE